MPPAAAKVQSPRAPAVAPTVGPRAAAVPKAQPQPQGARWEDEPASGGWDTADTATSFPEPADLPAPPPRAVPAVQAAPPASPPTQASPAIAGPATATPATPASPGAARAPYPTSPGIGEGPLAAAPAPAPAAATRVGVTAPAASPRTAAPTTASHAMAATAGLGSAMREEVWAIVRAAVEEAMGPIVARQRELEARVERAERDADRNRARPGQPAAAAPPTVTQGGASAAARLASIGPVGGPSSIPVALGPSLAPPAFTAKNTAAPSFDEASTSDSGGTTIPDMKAAPRHNAGASAVAHPVGPRPSLPPQGYGVTVVTSPRASLDLASVGPVDIDGFDGGRRKRRVASAVVVLMLLIIVSVVTMTVLSHG